jgi:site-specific DNA-methyltransferase (adenine-specific)
VTKTIETMIGTLILADCQNELSEYNDDEFGLMITDPPYGINENSYRVANRGKLAKTTDYGEFNWDKERISSDLIQECRRVSQDQVIFGGNYYADILPASSCWIVWDKNNSGDFADCEMAWTSFNTAVRKFRYTWNGMLQGNMRFKEKRVHPTQKPLPLIEWIIDKYWKGGAIIDPFAGSGTTAVACEKKGIKWVCIEKDERYFDRSCERLLKIQKGLF